MSKFEELCQAYATFQKQYRESHQACQEFREIFLSRMIDYFQCPLEKQEEFFDGSRLEFTVVFTLYENPSHPDREKGEVVTINFRVGKILNTFRLTIWWRKTFNILLDEPKHFNEVYDYLFAHLKEGYAMRLQSLLSEEDAIPF